MNERYTEGSYDVPDREEEYDRDEWGAARILDEPHIRIDKDALRFTYHGGGTNCFWIDLKPCWIWRGHRKPYWGFIKFYKQARIGWKQYRGGVRGEE